jgi:integrase
MHDTPTPLDTFLLARADRCRPATLAMYRAYIGAYLQWAEAGGLAPFAAASVRSYLAARARADRNDTLRNRARYVRLFCSWLVETGQLECSPFEGRERARVPPRTRARRSVYREAEIVALLTATGPSRWKLATRVSERRQWSPDGPLMREALQGRALVLLLVDSALRAAEAAQLTCGHVRAPELRVRSKGGHLDVAFVSRETRAALVELAGDRPDAAPLFRDWKNRAATTRGLRGIVQRLARRAGVELPERPLHAFRHYAARQWVKAKVPDLVIRQLMRHESLSTTQIYTVLSPEELAELHEEASPIRGLMTKAGLKHAA